MKIFRESRKISISEGSRSFLVYGISEIILVVIGILIAVQLNNLNENRKSTRELNNILSIVKGDLQNDLEQISTIFEFHSTSEPFFKKILADSLSIQDYRNNPRLPFLILGYPEFSIDLRGYNLLNEFKNDTETSTDTLIAHISEFYTERMLEIKVDDDLRSKDFEDNYMYWKNNYSWWKGYISQTSLEGFIDYSLSDPDYKNRVASFYFLSYQVYLPELLIFRDKAKQLIVEIDLRLN